MKFKLGDIIIRKVFGPILITDADEYMYVLVSLDDDPYEYQMSAEYVDKRYELLTDILRVE